MWRYHLLERTTVWRGHTTPAWWTSPPAPPREDRGSSSEQEGRGLCCPETYILVGRKGAGGSHLPSPFQASFQGSRELVVVVAVIIIK